MGYSLPWAILANALGAPRRTCRRTRAPPRSPAGPAGRATPTCRTGPGRSCSCAVGPAADVTGGTSSPPRSGSRAGRGASPKAEPPGALAVAPEVGPDRATIDCAKERAGRGRSNLIVHRSHHSGSIGISRLMPPSSHRPCYLGRRSASCLPSPGLRPKVVEKPAANRTPAGFPERRAGRPLPRGRVFNTPLGHTPRVVLQFDCDAGVTPVWWPRTPSCWGANSHRQARSTLCATHVSPACTGRSSSGTR